MSKKNEVAISNELADKQTDTYLKDLEKQLAYIYKEAWQGIKSSENEFFQGFKAKEEALLKQIEEGKLKLPNGMNELDYLKQWRQNQIALDDRWNALRNQMADRMTNTNVVASSYVNDKTPTIYSLNHNYSAYQMERETGVSFTLVDEQTVRELITGENHTDFKVKAREGDEQVNGYTYRFLQVDRKLDYSWNRQQIQAKLTSGILQGKSIDGIANDFMDVMQACYKSAVRNARTSVTSAQNSGRQKSYEQAEKMGIQIEKEWIATLDDRTRESHQELDGVRVPYDEKFSNGLMYPADPSGEPCEVYNCRCTMRAITKYNKSRDVTRIVENDKYAKNVTYKGVDDTKAFEDYLIAKYTNRVDNNIVDAEVVDITNRKREDTKEFKEVVDVLDKYDVDTLDFERLDTPRDKDEIIQRLAGADKTKGSCASLSLAYCGNIAGCDVLDFRGGNSQDLFSSNYVLKKIANFSGVKSVFEKGYNDIKNANKLLQTMELGKEYVLLTGQHASVVKLLEDGRYAYLELQSAYKNGWKNLDDNILSKRFKCTKSRTIYGMKLEQESWIMSVDSLAYSSEVQDVLKYLNTNESKQMKGEGGYAK